MPPENDWVLYAPYSNKSMLRNVISFESGRKMDRYCYRSVFCEVILNDSYIGVYTMMEKIKKDEYRVDIATLNPDEITGDDLTGGYIIKVDKIDPDYVYDTDGWLSIPDPPYPNAYQITFQYYYPDPGGMPAQQKAYYVEVINMAGQHLKTIELEKKSENIIAHHLKPGIYLLVFKTKKTQQVLKFPVAR